jgi:hypothetical protein
VHRGDQNPAKGVYHINPVDEVIQWQILAERIREAWLEPVLAVLLRQFPLRIRGFHPTTAASPSASPWPVCSTS